MVNRTHSTDTELRQSPTRRRLPATATIVMWAVGSATLLLLGCDTTLNGLSGSARPTDVSATDGEYGSRIEVTWTAPEPAEGGDGDDAPELIGYDVIRTDPSGGTHDLSGNLLDPGDTFYTDSHTLLRQGVLYEYAIQAVYSDGPPATSRPDTGYAITASGISAGSTLRSYVRQYDTTDAVPSADGKVWFRLLAQRGWTYEVLADPSSTDVGFLHEEQLEPAPESIGGSEPGSYAFTADHSGVHFLELQGGNGSVSVRYLGIY